MIFLHTIIKANYLWVDIIILRNPECILNLCFTITRTGQPPQLIKKKTKSFLFVFSQLEQLLHQYLYFYLVEN